MKITISKGLVGINSISSVGAMLLNSLITIWLQQYLLNRVSPEEYSLIAVLGALMIVMPLFSTILTSSISRFIIEAFSNNDSQKVTQIVSTIFPFLFTLSVIIALLGYFTVRYINKILVIDPAQLFTARIMLSIMLFSFVLRLLLAPFSIGLYVQQKIVILKMINIGTILLRIMLLAILLLNISTSVIWVVASSTISELIGLFLITYISCNQIPELRYRRKEFRRSLVKPLLAFGWWNSIGQLGSIIRSALDPIILNRYATSVDVTVFYLGSLADRLIRRITSVGISPILPQLTAMHANNQKERIAKIFLRLGRFSVWVTFFMIGYLFVYGKEIFQIYLKTNYTIYSSASTVMLLLIGYLPMAYCITGLNYIVVATAKNKAYMIITALSQLLNLAITFYLVVFLKMGAVGSAAATLITGTIVTLFAYLPLSFKIIDVTLKQLFTETIIPGFIPGLFSIAIWFALREMIHPSNLLELFYSFLPGAGLYILVLLRWSLRPEDRRDFEQIAKRIKRLI